MAMCIHAHLCMHPPSHAAFFFFFFPTVPRSVQQRWNEILLDSDETDDGLCEWAKLSWQDRLRIVAEYVTTAHSQENGQKEKEKKKKKNEQEQEQEQTP